MYRIMEESRKHFVLVHGACHGAWCWYKVKPVLERAGHQVTALDLAASGINSKNQLDVRTLSEYSEPLIKFLESLREREKVILVGHSLGGMNIAFAAEKFPEKISTAVFLTAFMPDSSHQPSYVIEKYFEKTPMEEFMDSVFTFDEGGKVASSVFFGPKCLSSKLYQLSPMEELALATMFVRVGPFMGKYLSNVANKFSEEKYGSVGRVYVVCKDDKIISESIQLWMTRNYTVKEVIEIEGADHMPMFSAPQALCRALIHIARMHA
ncbi:hypothetical protein Scep_000484 [Stephania cephalantha]|uniref:AB hydrolase-1 domain-containing protein n=1 Tax=Stephania cephalantha TaxID=152367 RepID=A0AAP0Q322_9MAGN